MPETVTELAAVGLSACDATEFDRDEFVAARTDDGDAGHFCSSAT